MYDTFLYMSDIEPRRASGLSWHMAQRIRETRKQKGWTYARLAVEADMTRAAITGIDTGSRTLAINDLPKICAALDIDILDLLKPTTTCPSFSELGQAKEVLLPGGGSHLESAAKAKLNRLVLELMADKLAEMDAQPF